MGYVARGELLKDHGRVGAVEGAATHVLSAVHTTKSQRRSRPQRGNAEVLVGVPARCMWCELPRRKVSGQALELLLWQSRAHRFFGCAG